MKTVSLDVTHAKLMAEIAGGAALDDVLASLTGSIRQLWEVDECWLGQFTCSTATDPESIELLSLASADGAGRGRDVPVAGWPPSRADAGPRGMKSFDTTIDRRPWVAALGDATGLRGLLMTASPSLERPQVLLCIGRAIPCTFPIGYENDLTLFADLALVALRAYGLRTTGDPGRPLRHAASPCEPVGKPAPVASENAPSAGNGSLKGRDREVLELLVQGLACKEVALELGLSHRTIEHYVERLKARFQQPRLHGLVAYAIREGLCPGLDGGRPRPLS